MASNPPSILFLLGPTPAKISSNALITTSALEITCSQSGQARVTNAAGAVINDWSPVTENSAQQFVISGAAVSSVTPADGSINLVATCKNSANQETAGGVLQTLTLDRTPPPSLTGFTVQTGTVNQGDITLHLVLPQSNSDMASIRILRAEGAVSPTVTDCRTSTGVIRTLTAPFLADYNLTDSTLSNHGAHYSYLVCIQDDVGNLTANNSAANIASLDSNPPPRLASLTASTGTVADGDINLSWTYPADIADYHHISIRALAGATAPTCTSGTEISNLTVPFSTGSFTHHTGSVNGDYFSYRYCIYDAAGNVQSVDMAENIKARDTTAPSGLVAFSAATGTVHKGINLTLSFPASTSDFQSVDIRMVAGASPPANCNEGTVISHLVSPYQNGTISVVAPTTEPQSFRVCIRDQNGNTNDSGIASNVSPKDAVPPPDLNAFSAEPGANYGEMLVTVDFPDTIDYNQVSIRRIEGDAAPADCSSGFETRHYDNGQFIDGQFTEGLDETKRYSYRVCISDRAGNTTNSRVLLSRAPKAHCHMESVATRTYPGLKAAYVDPIYVIQNKAYNGWAPYQILSDVPLKKDDMLYLSSSTGISIYRIYPNHTNTFQSTPCPNDWKIYFKRTDGTWIQSATVASSLTQYTTGFAIPENDVKAYIGYHEASYTSYSDNEGIRSTAGGAAGGSGGCTEAFRVERNICN